MPSFRCKWPTCATLLNARGYCPTHAHLAPVADAERHRRYDQTKRKAESKVFYDSAAWKRTRAAKLAANPWCQRCKREWAVDVHHVRAVADAPELRLDLANLESLCKPCHSRQTARDNAARRRGAAA